MDGELGKVGDYIKQHWMLVGGIAAVVFLFILLRARSGGGGVSSGVDPATAALYAQQGQQASALTAQQNTLNAELQKAGIEAQYGIDLATINAKAQGAHDTASLSATNYQTYAQLQLGEATIASQLEATRSATAVQLASITAHSADIANSLAATQNIANLTAQEQLGIAQTNAQVAVAQSNNLTQLGIAQSNASVTNAKIAADASKKSDGGWLQTAATVVGAVASFL